MRRRASASSCDLPAMFFSKRSATKVFSSTPDLAHGLPQRLQEFAQAGPVLGGQGVWPFGAMLLDVGPPGLGQGHLFAASAGVDADEPFVLKLAEGRVDGAGTWGPGPIGALGDGLHQLVAMHRLLAKQQQNRGPDVTATPSASAVPVMGSLIEGRTAAASPETGASGLGPAAAEFVAFPVSAGYGGLWDGEQL